jgi:hypothetical protein
MNGRPPRFLLHQKPSRRSDADGMDYCDRPEQFLSARQEERTLQHDQPGRHIEGRHRIQGGSVVRVNQRVAAFSGSKSGTDGMFP